MELRHLRNLLTVAEQGSVARAARKLRVAQPAMSRQIRALENMVGVPLLERQRRGVRLTAAGARLVSGIRSLSAQVEEAHRRVQLAHEGRFGTLRLALGKVALSSPWIGGAITAIREQYPSVHLEVSELDTMGQAEALRAGSVDLAIGMDATKEHGIRLEVLYDDPLDSAALPVFHPLAGATAIDRKTLKRERLVLLDPVLRKFPKLYQAVDREGFEDREIHDSAEAVQSQVVAGRGWTLAPRSLRQHPPAGVVVVPITGFSLPFEVVLRSRADEDSRMVGNIAAVLRTAALGGSGRPRDAEVRTDSSRAQRRQAVTAPLALELRQLRALVATAEHGSLSAAAQRLGLTQSGVSRQVRALEREMGMPLLRRGAHGVAMTAAGETLRGEATRLLAVVEQIVASARITEHDTAGTCRIGTLPIDVVGDLLSRVIGRLTDAFPAIAIEVKEFSSWQQCTALRTGDLDVGIAGVYEGLVDDSSISAARLSDDPVECALLATAHPLASRASLKPADLANERFLFGDRASYGPFYDMVMLAFARIGLVPRIDGTFSGTRMLHRFAADAMGWTLGRRGQRADPPPGLVAVPIEGLHIPWGVQLLWRRDEPCKHVRTVVDAFLSEIPRKQQRSS